LTTESDNSWLAVDVGNSRIKVGLFETTHCIRTTSAKIASDSEREDIAGLPRCIDFRSVPLKASVPWDELFDDHAVGSQLNGVIVGSNQRGVDEVVSDWPDWLQKPVVIRSSEFFPIDIQVDEPRRVGLDRLLNAVAADAVRDSDKQAIIVDCGTATTVDLVSSGSFCGGAILPGFTLCARALNQYTEVLPLISMNELFDLPPSEDCHPVLGSNTQAAIMSGVFWGQIGAVRELINRLNHRQKKSDSDEETLPEVLLTGGGARLLVPYFANAIHCPFLPLQGLVLAAANAPRP
jgi:type III pantothenate kinase